MIKFFIWLFPKKIKTYDIVEIDYYCSNCGQYLGISRKTCDRCGSNRWTTEDPGVGIKIRGMKAMRIKKLHIGDVVKRDKIGSKINIKDSVINRSKINTRRKKSIYNEDE
jgi:hypothetical protein